MTDVRDPDHVVGWLGDRGVGAGDDVGLAIGEGGLGLAVGAGPADGEPAALAVTSPTPEAIVADVEASVGPRWVWWDRSAPDRLVASGVEIARCWDVVTVHRLLEGGWRTSLGQVWACLRDLDPAALPHVGQLDLLTAPVDAGDPEEPLQPDGHLRPEWVNGAWASTSARMAAWAQLALIAAARQRGRLAERPAPERAVSTARSESAAEVLCAELSERGLPLDVAEVEVIIADAVGPRPRGEADAGAMRIARDRAVLDLLDGTGGVDLRNPGDVKAMLRRVGVDVPDTRAWRLERHRHEHPVVEALLTWRKAERIATTYGYRWLDQHVRGGRLRGEWSSCDGAAGRMTASAGLHNLPAELRPAVAAEPGHVFVRADLGQIEPRVLAAVSGDRALLAATGEADMYQPVARRLGVPRETAKVAVLGAMYGATTGTSAQALAGLQRAYPVAMALLEDAAASGRAGADVYTIGGRRVRMWSDDGRDDSRADGHGSGNDDGRGNLDRARSLAAARGRYARNAVIQGAAAELFKVWAVSVRAALRDEPAEIVLCLHDELLVHVDIERGPDVARLLDDMLVAAGRRWSPHPELRFVADVSLISRWSEA